MLLSQKPTSPSLVGGHRAREHLLAGDDIPYDRVDRARVMAGALSGQDAEIAGKRATSRRLEAQRVVPLAHEQVEARRRHLFGDHTGDAT